MSSTLKISPCQINTTACDIAGNVGKIIAHWKEGESKGADLCVTCEQSISGYPIEDAAQNRDVLAMACLGLERLILESKTMQSAVLVGLPEEDENGLIYNVAYLVQNGTAKKVATKRHLPNTDVFDEERVYAHGGAVEPFEFNGIKVGLLICQDVWEKDVADELARKGAKLLLVMNSSPFYVGKHQDRINDVLLPRVNETGLPIIYVNQVGGQDELVFDGRSTGMNADGSIAWMMPGFEEANGLFEVEKNAGRVHLKAGPISPIGDALEESYRAIVLGTRDYIRKTGNTGVLLGMSGGIDSALVAAIAADAIGPQNVHLFKMPSEFSSADSVSDADLAAGLLGSPIDEMAIKSVYDAFMGILTPHFNHRSFDSTEENLQARIRGTSLMAISNKNKWLVLSTGNKSEVSVGFCTLYGDMNGGFNPIKDAWKMIVYALSRWRNTNHNPDFLGAAGIVVPESILSKEPSADLRPGQIDKDSLPPYPVLDSILELYVEQNETIKNIVTKTGFDEGLIRKMINLVDLNEFKRRQACPGVKITECNFGKGRRVPIVRTFVPRMLDEGLKL